MSKPIFGRGPSINVRVVLFGFCSLFIALAYVFTDWLDQLKNTSTDVIAPFYWVADLPERIDEWADNRLMSRARLIQENSVLRSEVLVLRRKLQRDAFLTAENLRLRELLNASDTLEDRVLIAELIGVSPEPDVHRVMINRGSDHGVYVGQAVLDAKGLMGQVVEVARRHSTVLLITDATHALPVQINRNGTRLVAEGTGDLYQLRLRHVANTLDIRVGDLLVSSGLGQRFPAGYPVAEVSRVEVDPSRRFALVEAVPKADLDRSRHLLLVFDRPPGEH